MSSNSNLTPLQPQSNSTMNPQVQKDLEEMMEAKMELSSIEQHIKQLAAGLSSMSNPMLGMQEIMIAVMGESGAKVNTLSATDNLDSDLRSGISSASSNINAVGNNTDNKDADAQKFLSQIQQLEAFIKQQEGEGSNASIDQAGLKNLQDAVNQIKSAFGSDWGNVQAMGQDVGAWTNSGKGGNYPPQLKSVQDGLQTLTQSTSAFSTTTNTKLQYTAEQFKQFMGIANSVNQSWLKITQNDVTNQRSS